MIEITRPDKKNALTGAMYDAMTAALSLSANEAGLGAVVLTGSNGVFTAGNDINDFLAYRGDVTGSPGLRFIKALARFEKPLVAAVDGLAIGIGTTMLLHCDLVYASPTASLRVPFVDLGLTPEGGSSMLLPRRIGMARASELLLLGEAISAERAERFGLVNAVVPAEELRRHALEKAKAARPQAAEGACRRAQDAARRSERAHHPDGQGRAGIRLEADDARGARGLPRLHPKGQAGLKRCPASALAFASTISSEKQATRLCAETRLAIDTCAPRRS